MGDWKKKSQLTTNSILQTFNTHRLRFNYLIFSLVCGLFLNVEAQKKIPSEVVIQWQDSLMGDFSFCKQWSYTDGLVKSDKNEIRCIYNCHPRIEKMYNSSGQIIADSLNAFYSLIDTTHYKHTLECEAWSYEYVQTYFITCIKNEAGFINCYTMTNNFNRSCLRFSITNDKCLPTVQLNSANKDIGYKIFKIQTGNMNIDKGEFYRGMLKAEFNFTFMNSLDAKKTIIWKGKILSPITEL